ncbi:transcription elongation factor GreA (plasmid) [Bradyrhizobium lupini]|uniref:transcription elongation factor GreA n=1 Tax=Rhizobium lupini TaxID=136996 RepID=UPI00366DBDD5
MNDDLDKPVQKFPMTKHGYSALQQELGHLVQVERPRIAERIRYAIADDPNLPENAEYQAAKSDQNVNEARIAEIQNRLARAEVIEVSELSGDTVKFGATVRVIDEDTGDERGSQIVGEPEADAARGKISVFSPLARALIGKKKDTTVEVLTPRGAKAYRITSVEWG